MAVLDRGTSQFDGIANFRDVAASVNEYGHQRVLRLGQIYRSARPDMASASDRIKLTQHHALKTIIDLRSQTEHIEASKKLAGSPSTAQPAKIAGIQYREINLNGRGFERHLVWQLSYLNLAWLIVYMGLGYRLQGIGIIGRNVLLPRGLVGLGKDTIEHSGPELKAVFEVLADPDSYPVLIHCTQGKDRTGLVVALILLLCDIDLEAIGQDYVLSEEELRPEYEERMKEIRSIGLDESFAKCPDNFVREVAQFIESNHGNVERYLNRIGITNDQIDCIRMNFKNEASSEHLS